MKFLKFLIGIVYLATPFVGWFFLYRSFKRVEPGEISIVNTWDKPVVLEAGIYFYPFPWDRYEINYSKTVPYINFGSLIRLLVRPGQLGVKMKADQTYESLQPGVHFIDTSKGEVFDLETGLQNISSAQYNLGSDQIYTITEGQVAVLNTKEGVQIQDVPGQHTLKKAEGTSLREIVNTSSQVLELPSLIVMCSDQINMKATAMLTYKVIEPSKTVSLGMANIIGYLNKLGDGTLRTILSRYSSADVAPSTHSDEKSENGINRSDSAENGDKRAEKLKVIHDKFVTELDQKAAEWGLKITDLLITDILPADDGYKKTIQTIGTQRATAEAEKKLAETNAQVASIKAQAEQSKIIAAEKEQTEAMIRAQTDVDIQIMHANANSQQTIIEAKAQARAIGSMARAKANSLSLFNTASKNATELSKAVTILEAQGKAYHDLKNPVFIPQLELGQTRVYSGPDGQNVTLFNSRTNHPENPVNDLVAMQVLSQLKMKRE